ncbi:Hypothetical predicted protein [Cloeon dipterum]|uniref:Caprin-1 dimerization domain-containing protein n=1 Tax=Cloeon dipterum TaxID=197152 RepID=A0A8S1DED8_9INSE|nr:Hypothetical predicted protein [Cloeon dipterum]
MPSASAKLEKQTSTEVVEPLKLVLTMIEHKKRNLEKRKVKLEAYKAEQKNGKELNSEQQSAVSKYDEVIQTLVFANDLVRQIQQLELDHAKIQKKQQKKDQAKEQSERYQRDMQRTKDLITIQNVLKSFTDEVVRSDFLAGKNGAVILSKEDLNLMDEVSLLILPNDSATDEGNDGVAQFLVNLLDRKKKEWKSTSKSYADIFALFMSLNDSDYFRNVKNINTIPMPAEQQEPVPEEESVVEIEDTLVDPAIIKKEISSSPSLKNNLSPTNQMQSLTEAPLMAPPAEVPYFVAQAPEAAPLHFIPPQQQQQPPPPPPPVHLPPRQIINDVIGQTNNAFDFLQESQIEAEAPVMMPQLPPGIAPPPSAPAASAVPQPEFHQAIPSQTFTNQSFHVIAQVPQQQPPVHPQSSSPKSTMQPYPAVAPQPAFIEEVAQMQLPEEPKQPVVAPTSFAQAATYSSLAQKPPNFTNGPPGFPPQQPQKMQQSQFQPIPTLEQEQEKESNTWNGGAGDSNDDQQHRSGFRGKGGGRGGRGRGVADRNGYGSRPRQNGQGRPGGYRQDKQDGERGSYENGVTEHKGGNFRPRGPPRDGPREPREFREPREPKEWKDNREWQNQEPRDNSGARRGKPENL